MKRPILVAVIGYIIGIIWGLYFKFSIALLYLSFILITAFYKAIKKFLSIKTKKRTFKIFYIPRYFRYIKLIFNKKVITTICLFSCISNTIIIFKNSEFENLYKKVEDVELIAIVKDLKSENEYKKTYKITVLELNKLSKFKKTNLYLKINKKEKISYGNVIQIKGRYEEPKIAKNYKGFDYKNYLKTLNVFGIIEAEHIEIVKENGIPKIEKIINEFKNNIKQKIGNYLKKDNYGIYLGLLLGDTSKIEDSIQEQFQNSNMSHILAVSGMHISYIIIGISFVFNSLIGKKWTKFLAIIILILYVFITGFSPSIIRAVVMAIMVLISGLIHRCNDLWSAMALSLFLILIYNPFLITSVSLQYSYLGTIGIIFLSKTILNILNKGKTNKSKINNIISVSISAQIFILPITLYHFNTFGIYFLITNFCISFIIRTYRIFGIYIFYSFSFKFAYIKHNSKYFKHFISVNDKYK